jgi:hypothetical protein
VNTIDERNEMTRQVRPRFRSAAVVIALASVAAACGSEESSTPTSVVVPGTEQWTDTGIDLSIDDTVSIEADGEISPSERFVSPSGPNGNADPAGRKFNVEGLEDVDHAGLIGRIGETGAPFLVGSQLLSKADTAGRLFLGINDGDVGNNSGAFTATVTVTPTEIDPASLAIDRLLEVFNAQDAEELADVFGDDVAFFRRNRGDEFVGADAASYWQGYFDLETGQRITDGFHAPDGRTYFVVEFAFTSGSASMNRVLDVEMDGEQLVSMGARTQNLTEVVATSKIDNLHAAFNDQDLDRLTEEFENMTYTSPSGEGFTGAQAAEHWAEAFGSTFTRTTGVFAGGDGAAGGSGSAAFVTEHSEPAGLSTPYAVELEMSRGQVIAMTTRRPQT